ncbi:MAG: 2-oxoacid:ferredoxin oxidoreductase subunit gamma [Elusimicrobia bacterium]|nr:2-oxoacid:ferredoxin oxidoreductase subunit gamma [Elusimicrobiota bacterium]
MKTSVIISRYVGQGGMLAGTLLCEEAMMEDKYVTFFPSYGAEMRGGTANCQIIISDDTIGAPVVEFPNILVCLNTPSMHKFIPKLNSSGNLILNSSLAGSEPIPERIFTIPANDLALEAGSIRATNMVMLGAVSAIFNIVSFESLSETISDIFAVKRSDMVSVNTKALTLGYKFFLR